MSRMKRTIWWSLCVLPLLVVVPLLIAQSARIDDATLRRAGQTGDDWLTYGLNQSETRFSPLKDIDTTNVSRLGLAWSVDLKSGGGGQEATPLVANGVIYAVTNWSVVIAVDARTGQEKWRWDPWVNQAQVRPEICCGVLNRGSSIRGFTSSASQSRRYMCWPEAAMFMWPSAVLNTPVGMPVG